MTISRRRLFQAGAGLAIPVAFGPAARATAAVPAGLTMFTEQLPTLADLGVIDATGGGSATIRMVNAVHRFHGALGPADTFAYRTSAGAQSYLGPVIVARRDVPFDLTVRNELGAHPLAFAIDDELVEQAVEEGLVAAGTNDAVAPRAAVHLHGGNTRPEFDGGPLDVFLPGTEFVYSYENRQESAGLWYHDHALAITRLNVYAGLASGYLIRDDNDPGDGSRLPAPPYEVPLVIQDRMFTQEGTLAYPANQNPTTPRPWAPEFFGDVATVNGKVWPNLDVAKGKYRFRVYNGSNARFYLLKFMIGANAHNFHQIGTDGGLLDAPVQMNKLTLGPGERADLVVDFAGLPTGAAVILTNNARTPFPDGPQATRRGGAPLPQIMRFTVTGASGYTAPLPATLRSVPLTRLAGQPVAATRTMSLVEILDAAGAPLTALLNNRSFASVDYRGVPVGQDTLEVWELANTTGDAHPIHLHFTQFQVLNRQRFAVSQYTEAAYGVDPLEPGTGLYLPPSVTPYLVGGAAPPPANERGWKDTVAAMPGEVTRILVPFGANAAGGAPLAIGASYTGEYVWHCHILEHEDNDMMQRYVIA
ncbi:multicopper oxidase family protein [Kribbella sp. NPDC050470]|uniref:multicopper oxidase family protein n=1 Tax=unclassified Kribbella TaxID=2644121 RepID=UPI0037920B7A